MNRTERCTCCGCGSNQSHQTFVIVLVIFGIGYLFAASVFVLVNIAPANWRQHFKQISTETVTALAVAARRYYWDFLLPVFGRITTAHFSWLTRKQARSPQR